MRKAFARNLYYWVTALVMFVLLLAVGTPMVSYMIVVVFAGFLYMAARKSVEIEILHRELERHDA